jgi:hypothetical protein
MLRSREYWSTGSDERTLRGIRFTRLIPALAGALALASASVAHAAPTWTEIASAPGPIHDVDGQRILFRQAPNQAAILDRRSLEVTPIPPPAIPKPGESVRIGFLTSHGALVGTWFGESPYARLHEWRDGALVALGDLNGGSSVRAAGGYAIWNDQSKLLLRDLAAGVTTEVATDAGNTGNDVAADGDVVWWGTGGIWRKRLGQAPEQLPPAPGGNRRATLPLTDGNLVVWREHLATGIQDGVLRGNGPGGPFTLPGTSRADGGEAGRDYAVRDGWLAYTRGAYGSLSAWRRSPAGVDEQVAPAVQWIAAVGPAGEVFYRNPATARDEFSIPGEEPVRVGLVPGADARGYGDHLFTAGGRWYKVEEGSLQRLSLTDEPTDGASTSVDAAPEGVVASTQATFAFSSTVPDATFQCRLDGGAWEGCAPPRTYTGLAEGPHSFLVRAVAPDGDVDPEPASQAWAVDVATPVVTISSPAPGTATTDTTPRLTGTAGQAYGDGPVTLELFSGTEATGTPQRTLATSKMGTDEWTVDVTPPLPEGRWTARARQSDHGGKTGFSTPRTLSVDLSAPEPFALRTPADGGVVGDTLGLTWDEAQDAGSEVSHYAVEVTGPGGTTNLVDSTCSAGTCSVAHPSLPEGEYEWSVYAHDPLGHARKSGPRSFRVDLTPPEPFALLAPADGARSSDTTPTLAWQPATDATAGIDHYDLWLDGRLVAAVEGTEFTPPEGLGDGAHHWHVVAVDRVGARRSSSTQPFSVDTTPPAAVLSAPPRVSAGDEAVLDASRSADANGGRIVRHEWDLDGDGAFERDTGASPVTTTAYPAPGEVAPAVRVTDTVGLTAVATAATSVRRAPPPGFPGVTINGGDRYTNDPDVTLDVVWLPFTTGFVVSNDGGFRSAVELPVAASLPWTLDDTGAEKLPRTIYLRFAGVDGARETYQDDIVLDQTAPLLLRAARTGRATLRLRARDEVSGVDRMQVTTSRRRPGRARRFRPVTTFRAARGPVFVRVRDRAGNWSAWRRAARR